MDEGSRMDCLILVPMLFGSCSKSLLISMIFSFSKMSFGIESLVDGQRFILV
jgi:hypothetical protein